MQEASTYRFRPIKEMETIIVNNLHHKFYYWVLESVIKNSNFSLIENQAEFVYIPEVVEAQEEMVRHIVNDISYGSIEKLGEGNPFYLSIKYVLAKAFESAVITEQVDLSLYIDNMGYNFEDLIEGRCGMVLEERWIKLIDMLIHHYANIIFEAMQEHITNKTQNEKINIWVCLDITLRVANIVGITVGQKLLAQELANVK